jgi:hypothetical protein
LYYHTIASLAGFRVVGFVGACGVVLSINKSSLEEKKDITLVMLEHFTDPKEDPKGPATGSHC